jgi:hypothetical protein
MNNYTNQLWQRLMHTKWMAWVMTF